MMEHSKVEVCPLGNKEYRKALCLAIALPLAALSLAGVAMLIGQERLSHIMPPCMLLTITGYNCLSCGATRATYALMHGHLLTAVWYNPLYICFLGWLAYLYVRLVLSLIVKPYRKYVFSPTLMQGLAVAAICVLFIIVRNTPFYRAIFF